MNAFSAKNKIKLYAVTFSGVSLIVLLISFISFRYAFNSAKEQLWRNKIETGSRECRELGRLLEQELQIGIPPKKVIEHLQNSITNTDVQSEFVCMYDKSGLQLCHPDPALIGQRITIGNSSFNSLAYGESVAFSDVLQSGQEKSGTRVFPSEKQRSSEIVNIYPVKGVDWMLATHANIVVLHQQVSDLYWQFVIAFSAMALLIIIGCYLLVRFIYRKYEIALESEIGHLNQRLYEITALNRQETYAGKERKDGSPSGQVQAESGNNKKRLITYLRDEMILLEMSEIALFFLEANTVYAKTNSGKQYAIGFSLDEVMCQTDEKLFYRANRQYIINIIAIKTIMVYGKNQLRLVTLPETPEAIIISKNKVADFKKWLDQ